MNSGDRVGPHEPPEEALDEGSGDAEGGKVGWEASESVSSQQATDSQGSDLSLECHPLCQLFPRLPESEYQQLRDSIKAQGQLEPITIFDGKILDGANRYRACMDLGIEPRTVEYSGNNPVGFVLAKNVSRRHLTKGQQAALVASATDYGKARNHGGNRRSFQEELVPLETRADRAAISGASLKTQGMADKVQKVDPQLSQRVIVGDLALPEAHSIVSRREGTIPKKERKIKHPPGKERLTRIIDLDRRLDSARTALLKAEEAVERAAESALVMQPLCTGEESALLQDLASMLPTLSATVKGLASDIAARRLEVVALGPAAWQDGH